MLLGRTDSLRWCLETMSEPLLGYRTTTSEEDEGMLNKVGMLTSLIPALDGGTERADNDCHVELHRMLPFLVNLNAQSILLSLVEDAEVFELSRVLSYEGTFLEQFDMLVHAMALRKALDL
jgi:hypothetical protein